jgi:hypothetical protein
MPLRPSRPINKERSLAEMPLLVEMLIVVVRFDEMLKINWRKIPITFVDWVVLTGFDGSTRHRTLQMSGRPL